jgi:chaperonin cofactor prefoldin
MQARLQTIYEALTAALAQAERALDEVDDDAEYALNDVVALRTQAEELVTRLRALEAGLQ